MPVSERYGVLGSGGGPSEGGRYLPHLAGWRFGRMPGERVGQKSMFILSGLTG
ncbi:MAG: hypothetical protein ACE5JA_07135 [bacterium]